MKRQLAIAVLALTTLNGIAFAETPDVTGRGDSMSAPMATTSDDRTSYVPAPERGSLPPSPYGLTNDPAFNYNWNP